MQVLNVNLMGTIHTIAAATPHLRETCGSIVNISSIGGFGAQATAAPYGVSKAGVVSLTMSAAAELAIDGIRVNAIAPGWVDTPMARPDFEQAGVVGKEIDSSMMGRAADPREIATIVSFLLSEGASFITAETIVADGGHMSLFRELRERVPK
jgi:3-oxoacyl-[acyl-carrier protein] reductase